MGLSMGGYVEKAEFEKKKVLDLWWNKIDYIFYFSKHIYEMVWIVDTDKPTVRLFYDMWDIMIEKI